MSAAPCLIVFSHLRWDFVYQRPQHLLGRFGATRPVIFFEEPIHDAVCHSPRLELLDAAPGVKVARLRTANPAPGFDDAHLPDHRRVLRELIAREYVGSHAVWFYTPMALPLLEDLTPQAVVYDCMDELSAFKFAPPQLLKREAELIERADVVFTGGPSLYRSKKDRHPNAHCFSSSVDAAHFARAKTLTADVPEQANIPRPRLGYFGVLDERIDWQLIDAVAAAKPLWQIMLVGPIVKVDPNTVPRRPNIHYFGQQPYARLPELVAGWDVCLLPFARNDSTKFISPTKTLEYMAAGKPMVGTPIADVAEPYGHIVRLASSPGEFVAACSAALNPQSADAEARKKAAGDVLAKTSWDRTAAAMSKLIDEAVAANTIRRSLRPSPVIAPAEPAATSSGKVVVVGAGPTGLSAAYHLGEECLLIDANERVGGWCRSIHDNGFTFDYAGHIMFSNDPYVHELYGELLGDNVHWQDREAWVYSKEVYTRYPFQGALYGLPADVIKECIAGAIEARYGSDKPKGKPESNGHTPAEVCKTPVLNDKGDQVTDCCADGVQEATAKLVKPSPDKADEDAAPKNFEEFIYKVWGAGIAKHFAIPYNRKIWAVDLKEMETSWLGGRVPMPDLEEMLDGALKPKGKPMGPNARFGYPLRGGFQALMDGFLPLLKGDLRTSTRVSKVSPSKKTLTLSDGSEVEYSQLISTMPLPQLIRAMGDEAPEAVRKAASGLRHTSVINVNLGVGRESLTEKHWIYYPEDTIFHRIFVQGNASPHCNAPGGFGLTCEITYGPQKPLPVTGEALIRRCIDDCVAVGIIRADDPIVTANIADMPYAYVVYDHARARNVGVVRNWLLTQDIVLSGRYSEWEYYNSDHAFLAGKKAAEEARQLATDRSRTRSSAAVAAG